MADSEETRRRERTRGDDAASSAGGDRGSSRYRDRGAAETRARARASAERRGGTSSAPGGPRTVRRFAPPTPFCAFSSPRRVPRLFAARRVRLPFLRVPTSRHGSRASSKFGSGRLCGFFSVCLLASKRFEKCVVTPCHTSTPRRFTIFAAPVSRTLSWRFCSRVSGSRRCIATVLSSLSHSHHTTFHTKRNNGCFRCYHPLPQGASPRPRAAARRRAGPGAPRPVPIGAIALRNTRRKKALSAPIAPGNARMRPRATPRRGNERRRSTRADLLSRSRVHRLSSAARPPASSAARPSRCVIIASAFLPTIYPT